MAKESYEKLGRIALLNDLYGSLLTQKQQEVFDLFYNEDYSLGEIAGILAVSRQAVFDNLTRGERSLEHYEERLGLLARIQNERLIGERLKLAIDNKDWEIVKSVQELFSDI